MNCLFTLFKGTVRHVPSVNCVPGGFVVSNHILMIYYVLG